MHWKNDTRLRTLSTLQVYGKKTMCRSLPYSKGDDHYVGAMRYLPRGCIVTSPNIFLTCHSRLSTSDTIITSVIYEKGWNFLSIKTPNLGISGRNLEVTKITSLSSINVAGSPRTWKLLILKRSEKESGRKFFVHGPGKNVGSLVLIKISVWWTVQNRYCLTEILLYVINLNW